MASRYTAEALLLLRQSPLCVKPPNLPPAEQWMGQPTDYARNQARTALDKSKNNDGSFATDPANRRSTSDRHTTRNASGSEEIVLGPPKMTFASALSLRGSGIKLAADGDRPPRDSDRFGLRGRNDQSDGNSYNGNGNYGNGSADRSRDNRNNRRRGDADQDGEGWSTVKPRKSFGHEGAERFHGRMGGGGGAGGSSGGVDRYGRDDRRTRDRDDGDASVRDRPRRTFDRDGTGRDGGVENDGPRRNGGMSGRGPWFKENSGNEDRSERTERTERSDRNAQRERIDRTKNWRERNPDHQPGDSYREKNNNNDRGGGRRWDRDRDYFQRTEREPEWLDEPGPLGDEPMASGGHTEEDLRQFMEAMKGRSGGAAAAAAKTDKADKADDSHENDTGNKSTRPELTPAIEHGPDRFFEQFSKNSKAEDANSAASPAEAKKDAGKTKGGKSSRFTSFFSAQEDTRRQSDTPTQSTSAVQQSPPAGGPSGAAVSPPDAAEKEAFQALLLKLQRQTFQGSSSSGPTGTIPALVSHGTPPSAGGYQEMGSGGGAPLGNDGRQRSALTSPNPLYPTRQAVMEPPRDDPRFRGDMPPPGPLPQQILHEMLMQRPPPMATSQSPPASVRPEQMIQELLAQRQHVSSQGQGQENMPLRMGPGPGPGPGMGPGGAGGPGNGLDGGQGGMRPGSLPNPNGTLSNAQSEFLVQLMRNGGRARQQEELLMRMPQPRKQVNIPSIPDRTADMASAGDYGRSPQRQPMRANQGPAGMYVDEQFARQDADGRPPTQPTQPTQILQRPPPPPGLEQVLQHGQLPPFLQQANAGGRMSQQQQQQQQQGPQGPQQTSQQGPQQGPQQPMIPPPPGLGNAPPTRQQMAMPNLAMPNLANLPNLPNMAGMSMGGLPNMSNLPNMTLHSMPPNMFPNFPQQGPFSQDGIPGGPPRNMPPPPPPGFYGGPQGPPGFLPPPGMGFQGPPDGMVFAFDGRGMPPMPPGVGYRRQ